MADAWKRGDRASTPLQQQHHVFQHFLKRTPAPCINFIFYAHLTFHRLITLLTNILCSVFYRNFTIRTAGACAALFGLRIRIPPSHDLPSRLRTGFCFCKIKASPDCSSGTLHLPFSFSIPSDVPGRRRFRRVTGGIFTLFYLTYRMYLFF
jgi:hypothetical protein